MEKMQQSGVNNILYEYRPGVKRKGKPRLLPRKEIEGKQGYISVYGFDEETQQDIISKRGTYGLQNNKLYSDLLYIDVDDNKEAAFAIKSKLELMYIQYLMFDSGSPNSYHFHIPIIPMYDTNINYIHKQWVEETFIGADLSIYKTSGVIRIEGSFHASYPGCSKDQIYYAAPIADVLDLHEYSTKMEIVLPSPASELSIDDTENLDMLFNNLLFKLASEGNRNNEVFRRAVVAKDLGIDLDSIIEKLQVWNGYWCDPPVADTELIATINSAYRMV